jgi:hypothetical protein
MLSIVSPEQTSNCAGRSRREFLKIGALAFGGLSLPGVLRAERDSRWRSLVRDRSVVMLNLQGGPTQFETFDPKMDVPSENRSMFGEVRTSLAGVRFGGQFPSMAKLAHKLAVIRSYRHGISSHGPAAMHVAAGGNATGACMGSLYSVIAGLANPDTGMPLNTIVTPRSIEEKYKSFNVVPPRVTDTGSLSKTHKPFDPASGGYLLDDMKLSIPQGRFDDRLELVARLDKLRRNVEASEKVRGADAFQQQAVDAILGQAAKAFDWRREDPKLVERYDTSAFTVPESVIAQRGDRGNLVRNHSPVALGQQMMLARRLCEAGCRFITVPSPGWDMHGQHEYAIVDGMPILGPALDKAVGAFIEDVEERGLSEKILLVITGEFGRTPKINKYGGRDHWGNLCPLVFYGGGLKTGQIVGESDRQGGSPTSTPVTSSNVLGTIMHSLLDVGELRTRVNVPRDVMDAITESRPIRELV